MANGGANISRGINRGAAQVYDTSAPINMYAKLMQQQQLRRAAEQKLLTDELSKVSSDGIREADIPEFTQKYQEVKDFFGLKEGIKDRREKLNYELEFNKKIQELKQIAGDSKNIAKNEQGFTNVLLNPSARERYTEDAVTKFQNSKKLSRKHPNFIRDYTVFEHQVDVSNTMKELADINKRILEPIKSVTEQEATRVGNVDGTFIRKVKRVPVEEQALAFGMAMDVNPKLKAGIFKLIPKNEGESYVDYKSRALPLLVAQLPAVEYGNQSFQANKDLTMQNLAIQRERRLAAGERGDEETYRQQVIRGIMNNDKKSIDEMKAYLPSGSTVEYLTSRPTKTAKGSYNFIRVDIPAVTDINGTIKKAGIVEDISLSLGDPKNRLNAILSEYIGEKVSPSKLNIEGGKPRGRQIEIKGQEKTTKPTITKYSQLQEDGISFLMKKNKGATREQIINSLIKAGKLPK